MFATWKKKNDRRKLVRIARRLAAQICAIGAPDLRVLSDDELIERLTNSCNRLSEAVRGMMVTTEQACLAFNALAQAFHDKRPN